MLRVHNTRSGREETFEPRSQGRVAMYVCGPTVYDLCHIGHARSYVVFDCLRRYLEIMGYRVLHIQNFTDVDEKISARARAAGVESVDWADRYIHDYFRDLDQLRVRRASVYPRTTEHIEECIQIAQLLIDRGHAYAAGGDVFLSYETARPLMGVIHQLLDEALACTPESVNPLKKNPLDFAVWKRSAPSGPSWRSPWGYGRPGWHTECAAMSKKYAGGALDLHGGGMDLIYPHHDSEAVISEAATGTEYCRYYLHNGFVTSQAVKMSKSRGNFVTVRAMLDRWDSGVIRWFLLSTQYRKRLEFHEKWLKDSQIRLVRVRDAVRHLLATTSGPTEATSAEAAERHAERFYLALDNDLDTPMALAALSDLAWEARQLHTVDGAFRDQLLVHLRDFGEVLGIDLFPPSVKDTQFPTGGATAGASPAGPGGASRGW